MPLIEIENLSKVFKSTTFSKTGITALKNLSLKIEEGIIFGLLGPNGAGKTTLVKILLGMIHPTSGGVKIFGEDVNNYKVRKKIGYLPEDHRFPDYMNAIEILNFLGVLSGLKGEEIKKVSEVNLKLVDIYNWRKLKVKKYSKGMLQRLAFAQSFLNNPELIILDEPTEGVDPIGRKAIRDIILDLKKKGATILLNSHLLSEIELVCDRVAILNKGELIKEGNIEDLLTSADTYIIQCSDMSDDIINFLLLQKKATIKSKGEFSIKVKDYLELNSVIDFLREKNILIYSLVKDKSSLENIFINLLEHHQVNN
ncbi:MAG: ABC transporter ATP-binding protein [Ignavibacteria bacterium]|nr:ABC transporter ATP-binding protein [Ignavibacteria bacterium]